MVSLLRQQLTDYFVVNSGLMAFGYPELLFSVNPKRISFYKTSTNI
jgi:hypothetical protein